MTTEPRRAGAARALLAAVVAALVLVAGLGIAAPTAGAATADDEALLFQLTNDARAANGKAPLAYDAAASVIARAWARSLASSGVLKHNPNLAAQVDAQVTNGWTLLGENVGYASSIPSVQNAYMNSSGHRANILGNYNRVGLGSARDTSGRVWTTVVFLKAAALPYVAASSFSPFSLPSGMANQQYVDLFGRQGDDGGLIVWTAALLSAQLSPTTMVSSFVTSSEFGGMVEPIIRLYLAYFERDPDATGLFYWVDRLRAGSNLNAVSQSFSQSTEFRTTYGTLTDTQFVQLVYRNVLGREADSSGLAYWTGRLAARALDRGGVMLGFSESAEFRGATDREVDVVAVFLGLLRRAPDSAGRSFWVGQLTNGRPLSDLVAGILASPEYLNRF